MSDEKTKLFTKKIHGDVAMVAKMLGISGQYANLLLSRNNAKRHREAIEALAKIISTREKLLSNNQ